jgi:hypothetical protein
MKITIIRTTENEFGTFGTLIIDKRVVCQTLELPWKNNEKDVSCIPAQIYKCICWESPTKGKCLHILGVPGRDNVLIHKGNTIKDSEGCILVGMSVAEIMVDGTLKDGVFPSSKAMDKLLEVIGYVPGNEYEIHIKEVIS